MRYPKYVIRLNSFIGPGTLLLFLLRFSYPNNKNENLYISNCHKRRKTKSVGVSDVYYATALEIRRIQKRYLNKSGGKTTVYTRYELWVMDCRFGGWRLWVLDYRLRVMCYGL